MRAIITRHYKTLFNASGHILGWGDSPRHDKWLEDVQFVSEQIEKNGIRFDAVYSSVLERARRTAMFHAQRQGIQVIHDTPALNEINYGKLFRKSKKWVAENYPLHKKDLDFVYPDGESFRQMQRRSVQFLSSLAASNAGKTILIVAHAGVIRALVSHCLGLDYARQLSQRVSHRYIGDFRFEGENCVHYEELGKPSGFISTAGVDESGVNEKQE